MHCKPCLFIVGDIPFCFKMYTFSEKKCSNLEKFSNFSKILDNWHAVSWVQESRRFKLMLSGVVTVWWKENVFTLIYTLVYGQHVTYNWASIKCWQFYEVQKQNTTWKYDVIWGCSCFVWNSLKMYMWSLKAALALYMLKEIEPLNINLVL